MKDLDCIHLIQPPHLEASIRVPGSKSLTNRALLLAANAQGHSTLSNCLNCEDTQLMQRCLSQLGVDLQVEHDTTIKIKGHGHHLGQNFSGTLDVGTAGTAARFLTAVLAGSHATHAQIRVDGSPRMRERPMKTLLDALHQQGAHIEYPQKSGFLPVVLAPRRFHGGPIVLEQLASSQFISALLLAALAAQQPTTIELRQGTPARPYVDMTLTMIQHFGGHARWLDENLLEVQPGVLQATNYQVEADASAASYFLGLAAIHGGRVEIPNLGHTSIQGDAHFHTVLGAMGAAHGQDAQRTYVQGGRRLHGVDMDLSAMPDMTLSLAVVALFAEGPTRIRGVEILRHHECDRLAAASCELRKLGATVEEHDDGLSIHPPEGGPRHDQVIETYQDHRMAMAFAMIGDIQIRDHHCCEKTFPTYFDELNKLGMVKIS